MSPSPLGAGHGPAYELGSNISRGQTNLFGHTIVATPERGADGLSPRSGRVYSLTDPILAGRCAAFLTFDRLSLSTPQSVL